MQSHTKRLGEMLVDAGLITPAQLQDALRHQRFAGGRMGTNLVALGFISEEVLMDFLAHQTGVPRADLRNINIDLQALRRVPRRLAEQLTILPVALKEPKTLVLAMADPSDLNAIDSARFASGLTIEPVVASHSALRAAIADQYRKLDGAGPAPTTIEVGTGLNLDEGLPVNFEIPAVIPVEHPPTATAGGKAYPRDPFFDEAPPAPGAPVPATPGAAMPVLPAAADPFGFFEPPPRLEPTPLTAPPASLMASPTATSPGGIIPVRNPREGRVRALDSFQTRTILLGLVRLLQKRGVLGDDELQRHLVNLLESGQLREETER